jgi:hypothetical protein
MLLLCGIYHITTAYQLFFERSSRGESAGVPGKFFPKSRGRKIRKEP